LNKIEKRRRRRREEEEIEEVNLVVCSQIVSLVTSITVFAVLWGYALCSSKNMCQGGTTGVLNWEMGRLKRD
jgi:hypothetical protein